MGFYIPWLVDAARTAVAGTGRNVIVSPGWQTRGHGPMRLVEIVAGHHTGTPNSAPGDYPSLRVVRDGRAGLAGPLSQYGLGRSGDVYVIAAGLCYHAGASAFAGFTDLNDEAIGIEAESAGDGRWSAGQLLIYPRLVAACLYFIRRGVDRYASHRTIARPAGRKPDPAGISDQWMRDRARVGLAAPAGDPATEEDLMFHVEHLPPTGDEVQERVIALPWQGGAGGVNRVWVDIANGNADMVIRVAHWRIHGGTLAPMLPDGTVLKGLDHTGGRRAPAGAYSLALNYSSKVGGTLVIEAAG